MRGRPRISDDFADDYRWLREQAVCEEAIADRYGITVDTMLTRLRRAGQPRIPATEECIAIEALDRMIALGHSFTGEDLPFSVDATVAARVIISALRSGRITKSGTKTSALIFGRKVPIYRPAVAERHLEVVA